MQNEPVIVGIDPGIKGAIVFLKGQSFSYELLKELNYKSFEYLLFTNKVSHIYIEKAQAFRGQGVSGMFNYGVGFGKLLGWCEASLIPYTLVPPQTWTKAIHKGVSGKDSKAKSIEIASRLFPKGTFIGPRSRTIHMGIIDALLIAEYGRRIFR